MTDKIETSPLFSAGTRASIDAAYDKACAVINKEGLGDSFRFRVAKQIFYLAQRGETDVHRLCVASIGKILQQQVTRERSDLENRPA